MGNGSGWAWGGVKVLWNVQDKIFFCHVNEEVSIGCTGLRQCPRPGDSLKLTRPFGFLGKFGPWRGELLKS